MSRRLLTACLILLTCTRPVFAREVPNPGSPEAAVHLLNELVATDTSLGKGQVPQLVDHLAEIFRQAGFAAADVNVVRVSDTAALAVRYRGSGQGGRPIDLLAHLDVVAARAEEWGRDPFELSEKDGYLIGRGVLDVKGEVALLVTTLLGLKAEGFIPTRDLNLVLTGDEETTGETADTLVNGYRPLIDAEYALNADNLGGGTLDESDGHPLLFRVQGSEKASARFKLTTRNSGGHSSQPRADNAIYEMADALKAVERYRFPVMWNDWTIGDFQGTAASTSGELGAAMKAYAANPLDRKASDRLSADSTFIGRVRTTCVATMLTAGHAVNALPQSANATISCRIFPGDSMQSVHEQLQSIVGSHVEVEDGPAIEMAPPSPLRPDVMAAVNRAIQATHPGARVVPTQSSYATDGATFRLAGIPTYGVGGLFIKESEQFAHGLNERIPVASFYAGLQHWRILITELAGTPTISE